MACYTGEEMLQLFLDSEEEFDHNDDSLDSEKRLDLAEDTSSSDQDVASSLSPSSASCTEGSPGSRSDSSSVENHTGDVAASLSPSSASYTKKSLRSHSDSTSVENHTENVTAPTASSARKSRRSHHKDVAASLSPSSASYTKRSLRSHSDSNSVENHTDCQDDCDQAPAAKKAKTKSRKSTLSWKTDSDVDVSPPTLKFQPARTPGPQVDADRAHPPISLFKRFFTEAAVETLCENTNAQAARACANGCQYKWEDVSVDEVYRYIGLVFYMALVKVKSISDYWRKDSIFSVPFPATVMSRDRFRTISWNLHMSHPDADRENVKKKGTSDHDRLFRVKPLMDVIRHACKSLYHPKRNLAVGERMVVSRARTGRTHFLRSKPTKCGFKLFVLADSSTGYTVDFAVYTGKNRCRSGHGLSYDVVTSLLNSSDLGSGYHLYMDKFYTSPKLFKDLLALGFGACGTYSDCPQNAANPMTKNSARGSIRWIRDGPLVFVKWMDTKEVSVCSSIHAATVQREQDSIACPVAVLDHYKHSGGVNLSEQLLQRYTTQHKTLKWYRKIFLHFLDIAATNAFIVHKELYGTMSHAEFLERLVVELCGVSPEVAPKQTSTAHMPVAGTLDQTTGRRTCVHCKKVYGKRLDTPWKCQACDVFLCMQVRRNCFQEWHVDVCE